MTKESGKKVIEQKVEDFEKNALVLKKKGHGETNIRTNYIDVLFEALGWNMKSHYDVVREYSQRDTSGTKKVDYAFKINGKLKFFVEAKEASIDLEHDKDAIYQAKRYAYSTNGRAPIVILTDFEAFRVFNVLKAPAYDNTERELLKKYSMLYSDYPANWDLMWDSFSKEAVGNGSLETIRGKIDKNTRTMDVDFLDQITGWREDLARNVAIRNKELSVDEINEAVQRILDRLLFIRNLEDREIEPENTLLEKTKLPDNNYSAIVKIFNSLDNVYNGLLFKNHFSEKLAIDDKTIKDIIKSMCYPVSPFQFDVIEPEILGRIYEKFLGSKIRLTESHQAKVEEKIEVRKAGGVYYTPEYIVNYIVENTVGKKIEGLSPEEIKKIKILDPACGSGSFLLGAYSYILDYHAKWYSAHKSDKAYKPDHYVSANGDIKVSLEKRGNILRSNIFGVDIDQEATEVAIMSLYLKMLDDGFDKGQKDLFFVKGHVLPDMTNNVKCGNSLIGTDYFDGKLDFSNDEFKEIKPFDWKEQFKDIFAGGGFDVVIGNPPWGATLNSQVKKYLQDKYITFNGNFDSYLFFIDKAVSISNGESIISLITPDTWIRVPQANKVRKFVLDNINIVSITVLPDKVFKGVSANCIIFVISKMGNNENCLINILDSYDELSNNIPMSFDETYFVNYSYWKKSDDFQFQIFQKQNIVDIIEKVKLNSLPLEKFIDVMQGIVPYSRESHSDKIVENRLFHSPDKISDEYGIWIKGRAISRYNIDLSNIEYLKYGNWLHRPRKKKYFEGPRILIQEITGGNPPKISACYFDSVLYHDPGIISCLNMSSINIYFFLGIINSNLMSWYHRINSPKGKRIAFPKVLIGDIRSFPIPATDIVNQHVKEKYDTLVSLVDQMLKSQTELHSAKSDADKRLCEQKVNMLDKKIDELVYKLYDLTDEEIKIVEGSA